MPKVRAPENLIEEMPLRKLVGQTLAVSLKGPIQDEQLGLIEERYIGTLIIPTHEFKTSEELRMITEKFQSASMKVQPGIPSFMCSEHEPGLDALPPPATSFPSSMALTASRSGRYCYDLAFATALELRSVGINMNLAPEANVNQNANDPRSIYKFGEDPVLVGKLSSMYVRGLQHGGVSAVAKFFPSGLGSAPDSRGKAAPSHPLERLLAVDLKPFSECIRVGVDAILLSNIEVPEVDPSNISALSVKTTMGLLRNRLGFRGLAVADLRGVDAPHGARKALEAGNDVVILDEGNLDQGLEGILNQAKRSRVFARRTREAALRLLKLKFKRLNHFRRPSLSTYGASLHSRLAQQIANDSITAVRNGGAIPMKRESPILLVCPTLAGDGDKAAQSILFEAMRKYSRKIQDHLVRLNPTPEQIDLALEEIRKWQNIVLCTLDAHLNPGQAELVRKCLEANPSAVLISMGNPYDLRPFQAQNCIATYGHGKASLVATADILFGQMKASGFLPIGIS
jgi:beta-N-acetylhexosaminidase